MRAIDGDRLKSKAQKVATEAWKMKINATVEVILNEFIDWINEAPTIDPERKKGKWVGYDGDWLKTMCKCSECGAMIDINEKYRNFFCYHCGAKMEESEE